MNIVFLSTLDANGIISGEFGFITADNVYHQVVYATDENGNFRLISSKTSFGIGEYGVRKNVAESSIQSKTAEFPP